MVKFKRRYHLCNLSAILKDNPLGVIKDQLMQATRPIDQANLFNACFLSVFAPPDHGSTLNYLNQLN